MAPPPGLRNWFIAVYPTLQLNPDWLAACTDYLQEHFPASTGPQMIKLVQSQLLLSDLAHSTLESAALLPHPLPLETTVLFPTRPTGVLFQIIAMTEIGQPALALLDVVKEKKELQRVQIKNEGIEPVERDDGEEDVKPGTFGRGMLKMRLSDGFHEVDAIEWRRIDGLRLGETQLGCKILVQNVKCARGMLLLSPASVIIKGHGVAEMEEDAAMLLEESLKRRLGIPIDGVPRLPAASPPPEPPAQARQARARQLAPPKQPPAANPKLPPTLSAKGKAKVKQEPDRIEIDGEDEFGGDFDEQDEEELLAMERQAIPMAEESARGARPVVKKEPSPPARKVAKVEEEEMDNVGFLDGLDYELVVDPPPSHGTTSRRAAVVGSSDGEERKPKSRRIGGGTRADPIILD